MNRISKSLVILGALLIWYAIVGFLIAPALIRHFGEAQLQKNFSPDSSIAKVRIHPFTGSFRVEGLQVAARSGAWALAWRAAEVNISAATLLKFYPVIDVLRLDGADVRYERRAAEAPVEAETPASEGGRSDWRALVDQLNLAEIPELRIDLLEVTEGRFEFTDHTAAELYEKTVEPVNFTLRDFTTVVEGDSAMRFVAVSDEGASLNWEGDFQSRPIRSTGSLQLSGLAVHGLAPYYSRYIRFNLKHATFGLSFDYRLDLSAMDDLFRVEAGRVELSEVLCEPVTHDHQLIAIDAIRAEGVDFRFPKMALDLARFHVESGETRIFRDTDGQINLARLVALPATPDPAAPPEPVEEPPSGAALPALSYRIGEVLLSNYAIVWEDALEAGTANFTVGIPQMKLSGLSSDLASPFQLSADYTVGDSGSAQIQGTVTPQGPAVDLELQIEAVPLQLLSPYAQNFGRTEIRQGSFDFSGRFQYAAGGGQTLSGDAAIRGIDFAYDPGLQATWSALSLGGMRLDLSPFGLAVERLALEQPQITYTQAARTDPAQAEAPADATAASAEKAGLPIRIGEFMVNEGRVTYDDARFDPAAEIAMEAFELKLTGLDLDGGEPAQLALRTEVNGSPFQVEGEINANRYKEATRLKAKLSGLSLPTFSPYSGQAIGRRIAGGSFDLESDWTIESSQLKASNKIRIDQFELGDRVESENAVSLPLDLAVTLLKGPGGVMDLSLPLTGDLSDPKVGIGQIVRTAIVGLITNVASAPFKLLSGLVDVEGDLSVVRFDPGSSELLPPMVKRLNALSKALKERPGLRLAITPQISAADESRLAETQLRLELLGEDDFDDEKQFRKRLTRRYREAMEAAGTPDRETDADDEAGLKQMLAVILPGVELAPESSAALAAARAAAIREHLQTAQGIEAERLSIQEPEIGSSESGAKFDLK